MSNHKLETEIIQYLMNKYPIKQYWFKSELKQITRDWALQDDFQFTPEDAHEFLLDVFEHFNIDYENFDGRNYIEYEYPIWQKKPKNQEIKPLTVGMIIESAKAGRWLYD